MYSVVCIAAYETPQTSSQTTTTNEYETEMYTRLQRPVIPEVHENSPAAVTATQAFPAGHIYADIGNVNVPIHVS